MATASRLLIGPANLSLQPSAELSLVGGETMRPKEAGHTVPMKWSIKNQTKICGKLFNKKAQWIFWKSTQYGCFKIDF
jgi:hypothetical protein